MPADAPWELRAFAARRNREEMLADLKGFLDRPMPAREVPWTLKAPKGKAGRFPFRVETEGWPPVESAVALGRRVAPEPKEDLADGKGPVQIARPKATGDKPHPVEWIKVAYWQPDVQGENVFWRPVEWMVMSWLPG
ncbi:MAG: hypothetical protein ACYTFI_19105, partial [Planctomycetota bacterium]